MKLFDYFGLGKPAAITARYVILLSFALVANRTLALEPQSSVMNVRVAHIEQKDKAHRAYYYQQVLQLALDKSHDKYGDYQLIFFTQSEPTFSRRKKIVIAGKDADIIWASVTPEREKQMRLVPVDLLQGYNNYRLLLIAKNNQDAFNRVKTLADLKKLRAGNGDNWTDTRILKGNGVQVTTTIRFELLIKMLLANRFDYISRGLHEIHTDLETFRHPNLAIEKKLVLKYKHPITYSFFVTKNNQVLAERIQWGLEIAIADGSFGQLIESVPAFKQAIEEKSKNRIEIELDNSLAVVVQN